MAKGKRKPRETAVKSDAQNQLEKLTQVPPDERTEQECERIKQLRVQIKRERFCRLAEKRVNNALKAIRNVGRMGNSVAYGYEQQEADIIMDAINAAVSSMCDEFADTKKQTGGFRLQF